MVLFNQRDYIANQILISEHFGVQALTETSMDVQTVWVAVRALGVATGLLVHASAPQAPRAPAVATATEISAEHWRHLPHAMSMDQVLAAFGR